MKLPDGVSSLVYRDDDGREIVRKLQPEWIPVSERLPDKEGSYLVTAQPTYNHAKDIRIVHWGGRWVGYSQSEIIAWMPLPEPYREDGEMNDE